MKTPEQILEEWIANYRYISFVNSISGHIVLDTFPRKDWLTALIKLAQAEERKRCSKIARTQGFGLGKDFFILATKISEEIEKGEG